MEKRIMLSPEKKLLSPEYKSWLAQQLTEKMLSRMQTANWLSDILYGYDGKIYVSRHYILNVHDEIVDNAFGKDGAFTWASDVKRFADRLPERRSSRSQLLKMQVFDAVYKIVGSLH